MVPPNPRIFMTQGLDVNLISRLTMLLSLFEYIFSRKTIAAKISSFVRTLSPWTRVKMIRRAKQDFVLGRKPWSSGYRRRLMFERLWVQIPAPYTGWMWHFFTMICCIVCLKRSQINEKEAGVGPFKNNIIF